MYDIIIVGAGSAGLTAAIYAKRAGKKVLVLEAMNYGGQIVNAYDIENYPANPHINGFDLATQMYKQALDLGMEFKLEKVQKIIDGKIKQVLTKDAKYECKSIILATGSLNKKLGLKREDEFVGKGVSYCATCDGNFYKDKIVAVVGGGNAAVEDALYLANIARKVYLIHRRDDFRADAFSVDKLKKFENVEFILKGQVTELKGNEKLEEIVILIDGNEKELVIDGLFVAVGREPANDFVKDLIKLDEKGYIEALEDCQTNVKGILVAGDCRTKKIRQLVTATADGATAAAGAIDYINDNF